MSPRHAVSLRTRMTRAVALMVAGAFALTGCELSAYSIPLPGGADLGDNPYTVTVEFRDVLDLVPQSAVKVDDVSVGKVDEIDLDGQTAVVTLLVRGDVELPGNAVAKIRQTSLLGEKFVALEPPPTNPSSDTLGDGDVIPLDRTGRNPEVEEVLGALSLLLNGGGVAQLKTISAELNKALEGRESDVKSVLAELDTFTGQLDEGKSEIIAAIESLDRLAIELNKQKPTIELALDELPGAIASIDRQRDDLVRMLKALSRLSNVGTRVIGASKQATIDSLDALAPTLTKLADAGDALPNALQVFLTYPFVDAVVGTNPTQARNLHMGDFTNLSMQLDIDLTKLPDGLDPDDPDIPDLPEIPDVCEETPLDPVCDALPDVNDTLNKIEKCLKSGDLNSKACKKVLKDPQFFKKLQKQCKKKKHKDNEVCQLIKNIPTLPGGGIDLPGGLPDLDLPDLGLPGLGRAAPGTAERSASTTSTGTPDTDLGAMLVWGMRQR